MAAVSVQRGGQRVGAGRQPARVGPVLADRRELRYISKGTVGYHLNKVFRKLGIRSRAQLCRALAPVPAHS